MSPQKLRRAGAMLAALVLAAVGARAGAPGHSIDWFTVDSGGGRSISAGGLSVEGTLGQWDSAVADGAGLEVEGGFWPGGDVDVLFADGFES